MTLSYRIVSLQLAVTLAAAALFLFWDVSQALAALAGGLVAVAPAALFAWRASVERSARRLLLHGVLKFLLSRVLLALAMILLKPQAAGFFTTFIAVQLMYVIGPVVYADSVPN